MEVHGSLPSNVQQHFFKAFSKNICLFCVCFVFVMRSCGSNAAFIHYPRYMNDHKSIDLELTEDREEKFTSTEIGLRYAGVGSYPTLSS